MPRRPDTTLPIPLLSIVLISALVSGCGTTTQKIATEQLLISDAVDQAITEVDFGYLSGKDVFLDTKYLHSVKGTGYANADYIISALREHLSAAGCLVQDNRNEAQIIVEPRVGALGTDGHEITYGIPQTSQFATAAAALSSAPALPAIPEISFGKSNKQMGIAKITLFAYERDSKLAVWQSGLKRSESTSNNTWVLGAGPFQKGTIHDGFRFAGQDIRREDQPRLIQFRGPSRSEIHERLKGVLVNSKRTDKDTELPSSNAPEKETEARVADLPAIGDEEITTQ